MKSYSQYNQDIILNDNFFKGKKKGIFVDIGAYDGVDKSNSFFYEKYLDWSGVCVEPIEVRYQQLVKNRACKSIYGAISNKNNDKVEFCLIEGYSEMLSGIVDEYDTRHIKRIHSEGCKRVKVEVPNYRFNNIVDSNVIDLLDIDTEGNEQKILADIDYSKYNINIVLVECNYEKDSLISFMTTKNFTHVMDIGADLVFKNNNLSLFV
jgi:FkbM family methyltransferase